MPSHRDQVGRDARRLYVVVRPSDRDDVNAGAIRCLRRLLPQATIVVAPAAPPPNVEVDVVTVDAEEVAAGPLSAALALERQEASSSRRPHSQ
jgi:hypothetical protein